MDGTADKTNPAMTNSLRLYRDPRQRLVLVDERGRRHEDVEPIRCFPISHAEQWISLCDASGHEVACIEDPRSLSDETRQLLEEELARREFVPLVRRILKISDDTEFAAWDVETDRGPTSFRINGEDAVRRLDAQRILIVDAHGIRYLIADLRSLDHGSRRLLDRYI